MSYEYILLGSTHSYCLRMNCCLLLLEQGLCCSTTCPQLSSLVLNLSLEAFIQKRAARSHLCSNFIDNEHIPTFFFSLAKTQAMCDRQMKECWVQLYCSCLDLPCISHLQQKRLVETCMGTWVHSRIFSKKYSLVDGSYMSQDVPFLV